MRGRGLMLLPALAAAALAWLTAGLSGCNEPSLASSEVGNPPAKGVVVGALLDDAEKPAAGARVRLYPVDHDPVKDSGRTSLRGYQDTADASGTFSLEGVDTGLYNVQAIHPEKGTMLLLRDLRVLSRRTVTARGGILKAPGTVLVTLPDLPASSQAYVYIAGTGVFARLDPAAKENPTVLLRGVPAGFTPEILYRSNPEAATDFLVEDVEVRPGDTVPALNLPGWARSMRIFMNTTPTGADVDSDAEHFPALVRLGKGGAPFDFSQAAGDGRDIRFTHPDGLPMKFEIERWDSAGGSAVIWVCVGTLRGDNAAQFMRMYWGNPAAPKASEPAFTTSLGYVGIWHMERMDSAKIPDASGTGNPVTALGIGIARADLQPSPMGLGVRLDGKERLLTTAKSFPNPHVFSLSLWFNTTSDSGGKLIGFGALPTMVDTSRDRHIWMDDTGKVHFGVFQEQPPPGVPKYFILTAPGTWNDGKWHQVGASLSAQGMSLYMDGRKVAEDTAVKRAQNYGSGIGYWRIGYDFIFHDWPFPPSALYFKGMLDEVRVSHKAFTPAWFRLNYETQREGGRLLRYEAD